MAESPSPELARRLLELELCSLSDLRAARRIVGRLCRDLPSFDSVWLDALVQLRRLTPYQAMILGSGDPDRIVTGPLVLVDCIGTGPFGETCVARRRGQYQAQYAVRKIDVSRPFTTDAWRKLELLVDRLKGVNHPGVCGPRGCEADSGGVVLTSRFVSGRTSKELLLRRGRFPAAVVWEIGRQMLDALQATHEAGLVHSDVRLSNVRLTESGQVVLVDFGVRQVLEPELTVHSGLPAELLDATAPELVGVNRTATPRSDLYAVGCVLWQLLAGRPPFPGADPRTKLAAHQTRQIADVRRWAPDTPADLANRIAWLTAQDPKDRPESAGALLARWNPPRRSGRRKIQQFLRAFRSPTPIDNESRLSWAAVAAALLAVSGLAVLLADSGMRSTVLAVMNDLRRPPVVPGPKERGSTSTAGLPPAAESLTLSGSPQVSSPVEPLSLPRPQDGVIVLDQPGPWVAGLIQTSGPLEIRAGNGVRPVLVVRDQPLKIRAASLRLMNVDVRSEICERPASELLKVTTIGPLEIESCRLERAIGLERPSQVAVAWQRLSSAGSTDAKGSDAELKRGGTIRNCAFAGPGTVVFASGPLSMAFENCLHQGAGAFLQMGTWPAKGQTAVVRMRRVTLRETGALFRCRVPADVATIGDVRIEPLECVLDLQPAVALVDFVTREASPSEKGAEFPRHVRVVGSDSLVRLDADAEAAWVSPATGLRTALPPEQSIAIEGLMVEPIEYAPNSGLIGRDGPVPGIDPDALPKPADE